MIDFRAWIQIFLASACLACSPSAWAQAGFLAGPEWAYAVEPGDTLVSIAARHLDPAFAWRQLAQLNRLVEPRRLKPGTQVRIPLAWLRHDPVGVEVVFLRGDVQRVAGQQATPLAQGDRLRPGEHIETGPQASATLRFADGSRLLLTPGSRLLIEHAGQHPDSRSLHTRLGMQRGTAETQVNPKPAERRRFEIGTPVVNLGVRGTAFRTHAVADSTRVEVLAGRVAVGDLVTLDAGFGSVVRPGQPVSPPVRLAAAPDLSGLPARIEQSPVRIGWPAVPGVLGYRAQLWADGPQGGLLLDQALDAPAVAWPPLPDGAYQLRVRVIDSQGLEGVDVEHALLLATQPAAPPLLQPAPDAAVRHSQVTLRWADTGAVAGYWLQVAGRAGFAAPEIDLELGPVASAVVALAPGPYQWRLASRPAAGGRGPFGAPWPFTVQPLPGPPLAGPPQAGREGVAWAWQGVVPAQAYQVQVAHEPAFIAPLLDWPVAGLQVLLPLTEPGRYALRVRSVGADGAAGPYGPLHWVDVAPPLPGAGRAPHLAPHLALRPAP